VRLPLPSMPSTAMSFRSGHFSVTADPSAANVSLTAEICAAMPRVLGFKFEHDTNFRAENLLRIQERIAKARSARTAGGGDHADRLSKTHPASAIREACAAGFGTLARTASRWKGSARTEGLAATWHLIGHLQSNKTARAAKLFTA